MTKLALIQLATDVGHMDTNYEMVADAVLRASEEGPHIIVLPETWNTGFFPSKDLIHQADYEGKCSQEFLQNLALKTNCHIVGGSVSTVKQGSVYNTTYIVDRHGHIISSYDKMHCFSPAKEDQYYTGGTAIHKFMLDHIACSSITCYDIRFPELVRMAALQNIDILFIPAQWPSARLEHWRILNQARAIENQMFVCAVNGCGKIGHAHMAGHSLLVDPFGTIQRELGNTPGIGYITIDTSSIPSIREKINVFQDRRPELYNLGLERQS
ncbi:carbon-nitrogen family hydrolase [uncultured Veillonella sp.]|uniref:carbon-nitrogen family hydrolase n=1 Tax=uncultured Veillonella sp. TaxID=159268 RepID=UPI00262BAEB6|nr:carbon-nitrogen family hydrolase [uncultured Veillonella sp.]